jgi:hypothetical protein
VSGAAGTKGQQLLAKPGWVFALSKLGFKSSLETCIGWRLKKSYVITGILWNKFEHRASKAGSA